MTQTDPLQTLWQADDPPARDHAFTAATVGRLGPRDSRAGVLRRGLTALGAGTAIAGAVLLVQVSGGEVWSVAVVAAAVAGALVAGGRLIASS